MKIVLVGNQNSGKTTLFNLLTGMNAKVGNWPGVTIERKSGKIKGTSHEIIDLPGIYSLSPYSIEEEISREFILKEKPEIIINIIDSTSLERSLYLTTQLLELNCKVIIALNMVDILEKKKMKIDVLKLENMLNARIIKISALKEEGINQLIEEIEKNTLISEPKLKNIYDNNIENAIKKVENVLPRDITNKRFFAIKLLEDDKKIKKLKNDKIENIISSFNFKYETDLEEEIATQRYKYIQKIKKECLITGKTGENISDKLDKIFLNRWFAFPIFFLIMFFIYYISVGVIGQLTIEIIEKFIQEFASNTQNILQNIGTSKWLQSLVCDGIIAGVGSVLTFIPELIILFISISILETSGYMSRIALMFDMLFRKIGLSGKSVIPFMIGLGCSVPGIMGTRIIENQDEREMTSVLTPFVPCSAKLPIIALFSGYFFGDKAGIVSVSLYFFSIIVIVISSLILKKYMFKNITKTYISELPEYKLPNFKYIVKDVSEKIISFIKRAGSVILICSIIMWVMLSFSMNMEYGVDIEYSILAYIGKNISCFFYPMLGTNSWEASVSTIQGLIAKEQVVSSMYVISGLAENTGSISNINNGAFLFSNNSVFGFFTYSSAYAFMVFNLFSVPCVSALGAMRKELGSNRKVLKIIVFQCALAWMIATLVYQIGIRIENSCFNFANLLIIGIVIMVVVLFLGDNGNMKGCKKCEKCRKCENSIQT